MTNMLIFAVVWDVIAGSVLYAVRDSASETDIGAFVWFCVLIILVVVPWIVLVMRMAKSGN